MARGKTGRPATPTNIRLLRGESGARVNRREPKPPVTATVEAPDYLDADARVVWDRLAPSLTARQILTVWDVDLFAAFCSAVVNHRRAAELVNAEGVLVKAAGRTRAMVKHPALQIIRDQAAVMVTIGGRFGLTPSDRSAIEQPPMEVPGAAASILD